MFEAMFNVNIKNPGAKRGTIQLEDTDKVFNLIKYYTDLYRIPFSYNDKK